MTNNDLNQIRIFTKVAHLKSFTKAANTLHIEKSTVSSKVTQLESRLGVRLLQRTTRSVSLTEAGEHYLTFCEQALNALVEGEDYLAQLSSVPSGRLRVSVPQNMIDLWMPTVITPFLQQYPEVSLQMEQSNRHVDLIKEKFDVAIRVDSDQVQSSTLIYRQISQSEWVLVAGAKHVEQYGLATMPEQLQGQPSVGMSFGAPNIQSDSAFEWQGEKVHRQHRLILNSMGALKQAVLSNLGFGILPVNMVTKELADKSLVAITYDVNIRPTTLYVVYPSRTGQPAALKAFVDAVFKWADTKN